MVISKKPEIVTKKKNLKRYIAPPPFNAHDNDKIGRVESKERI